LVRRHRIRALSVSFRTNILELLDLVLPSKYCPRNRCRKVIHRLRPRRSDQSPSESHVPRGICCSPRTEKAKGSMPMTAVPSLSSSLQGRFGSPPLVRYSHVFGKTIFSRGGHSHVEDSDTARIGDTTLRRNPAFAKQQCDNHRIRSGHHPGQHAWRHRYRDEYTNRHCLLDPIQ
jgi:hypothetical protein